MIYYVIDKNTVILTQRRAVKARLCLWKKKRRKPKSFNSTCAFIFGGEEGIRSRLRARSGSALTCHRQVIHYRPVRIPTIKKPSHTQGMARLLCERAVKRCVNVGKNSKKVVQFTNILTLRNEYLDGSINRWDLLLV